MNTTAPPKTYPRRTLLFVIAVFFLPFVVGSAMFWLGWRPDGFSNHGRLIQPPRDLPTEGLLRSNGTPLPTSELHGKWVLALAVAGPCGTDCQATLREMRQLQLALGKEQNRLQPVLFIDTQGTPDNHSALAAVQTEFPGFLIATIQPAAAAQWRTVTDITAPGTSSVHVIDPFGKLMMRQDGKISDRGVLKDIERLLKYSWVR